MKLGLLGLGRMGSNIARRLTRTENACVAFDAAPRAASDLAKDGPEPASSLEDMIEKLPCPRAVWMLGAGASSKRQGLSATSSRITCCKCSPARGTLGAANPGDDGALPYERLLGDAMKGGATLFASEDAVEAAWRTVVGILGDATPVHEDEPGTWGPAEAERIISRAGGWHSPEPAEIVAP